MISKNKKFAFGKRPTIGVLLCDVDIYTSQIWTGLSKVAKEQNVNTISFSGLSISHDPIVRTTSNLIYQIVSEHNVDGLIVLSAVVGDEITNQELTDFIHRYAPLPIVSVGEKIAGIPSIFLDNQRGLRDLLNHLINDHGHRKIGFLKGPQSNIDAIERYEVYLDVLSEHQIPYDPDLVFQGSFVYDDSYRSAEKIARQGISFSALVASDDESARAALNAFAAHGIHVPNDVAVTGFDDVLLCNFTTPPLTTVRQPTHEMGALSLNMIMQQLQGQENPLETEVSTQMVIRQSCGCVSNLVSKARTNLDNPLKLAATREQSLALLMKEREAIQTGVIQALQETLIHPHERLADESIQLLDAFFDEILNDDPGKFLKFLDVLVRKDIHQYVDLNIWQAVLSILRQQTLLYLNHHDAVARAEDLWQQARVFISELVQQIQFQHRMDVEHQTLILSEINEELITTFDIPKLLDAIAVSLPQLDIAYCFLCLNDPPVDAYDDPELPEWSNLILAYSGRECLDLKSGGVRFPTNHLIPEDFVPSDERFDLVVMPLRFQTKYLGYALFELGPLDGFIYNALQIQISSALQGASLIQQIRKSYERLEMHVQDRTRDLQQEIVERKQVEKTLRENELRYRALFENTNDAVFILDLEGNHLDVNQQAVEILGYSRDELLEMSVNQIVADADLEDSHSRFDEILTGKKLPIYERSFRRKDGKIIETEINVALAYDYLGNPSHVQSIVRDISERKRSERFLQTLNQATLAMQRSLKFDEVFQVLVTELDKLNFSCVLFPVDLTDQYLIPKYFKYSSDLLQRAEAFTKIQRESFLIKIDDVDYYSKVVRSKQTVYLEDPTETIRQILPAPIKILAPQVVRMFNAPKTISAPLIIEERVAGVLTIQSPDLEEKNLESITALAHQVTAAWRKSILLQDLETELVERKRAEEQFRSIFENAVMGFYRTTPDGQVLMANPALVKMLGYESFDELTHRNLEQDGYLSDYSRTSFREQVERDGFVAGLESAWKRKDGSVVNIRESARVVLDDEGNVQYYEGTVEDITERVEAETNLLKVMRNLEVQSNQLQTAAQISKFANTILDPQTLMEQSVKLIRERFDFYYVGLFIVSNDEMHANLIAATGDAGRKMLQNGYQLEIGPTSMVGWSIVNAQPRIALDVGKDAVHFNNPYLPDTRSEIALPLISRQRCIGAITVQSVHETAFTDESLVVLQVMAEQLAVAIDNARLYETAQREISDRKIAEDEVKLLNLQLEQRVKERTAELETAYRELEAFSYSVSHDLRAPLRGIDGFSLALLEDYSDLLDEEGRDYLNRVRRGTQKMGRLIDDILKLSRITRHEMHLKQIDMTDMVHQIAETIRHNEPDRNIEFVIEEGIFSQGDEQLIRISLENLLGNAAKYTSGKSKAVIEFGRTQVDGQEVYFVRDNGAGFNMEYQEKLFTPFQRLHNETEFSGSGIGLSIVSRVISKHNGKIWAEAEEDKGAAFYFTLQS